MRSRTNRSERVARPSRTCTSAVILLGRVVDAHEPRRLPCGSAGTKRILWACASNGMPGPLSEGLRRVSCCRLLTGICLEKT